MILIAFGSNLVHPELGQPQDVVMAALRDLLRDGIDEIEISRLYKSAPVPVSDQPWFVNGVARLTTGLAPVDLLARLHAVEAAYGRVRRQRNEARILDLDIVDYDGRVEAGPPVLPHPRAGERAFVLRPMQDLVPEWTHPATGESLLTLLDRLDPSQALFPLTEHPIYISGEPLRREAIAV
ncbi:MAG: 2-amino-4-hydroxy-6-hydroxymethyldihydropteridine diphosphokinase [Alphaproteobacteria bacterium]|nr:2-amino-4-hydroxy-6-hydroxymethyldihydropteridine diphosphokinase [Alphaproteobacteria bacterium]